ncbi:MAG: serine/threonine protein kinase [Anaerolineae bacterium]|nr:serine/threonine protein kinase [Anaerolineae bacterium]
MRLQTGQIVNNRYRVARLLGQGGMGAVYRAWDLTLNIPAALKEMIPDPSLAPHELAELRRQFQQEAHVLANLVHPNLPRVTDFFEWGGRDYLVMDFVEGESLESLIDRQGRVPERQLLHWAVQLLDALEACHQRNILHRDIKPQNIIICADGRAVLVDFGLVKLWDPRKPQTQRIIRGMGTREYASPEHFGIHGLHTEPRSDIYSLGATLYHALTGREPPSALDRLTGSGELSSPRSLDIPTAPHVETALFKALALNATERHATVRDMRTALLADSPRSQAPRAKAPSRTERVPVAYPVPTQVAPPQGLQPPPAPPVHIPVTAPRSTSWKAELVTGLLMAVAGTLIMQGMLFADTTPAEQYIGLSIGALILGGVGWFAGDTIFQALTMPKTSPSDPALPTASRPTQRLVLTTRRFIRKLSTPQLVGLLSVLVALAALAAWFLGPVVADIPFLWENLPSYAFAAPLAFSATGKRLGLGGVAHVLVATIGGVALRASTGVSAEFDELLVASVAGGVVQEVLGFIARRTWLKSS